MSYRTPDPLATAQARVRELEAVLRLRDAELAARPVRVVNPAPVIYRAPRPVGDGSRLFGAGLMLLGIAVFAGEVGGVDAAVIPAVICGSLFTAAAAARWG